MESALSILPESVAGGRRAINLTAALLAAWIPITLAGCGSAPLGDLAPEPAGSAGFAAGEIRHLDHPRFSHAEAERMLWTPVDALEPGGAGIYFLEPYDSRRIPVLFVHGIGGTPRDFRAMLEALDRTRFQAWVFQYPTGLRLHTASHVLYGILADLQREYHYDGTLFIVAHSMGGLVARGYLVEALREGAGEQARLLVTFSSPWEGHAWAQVGARLMPGAPASWTDLSPASAFLVALREPLARVRHFVFFGYRRKPSLLSSQSSDGAIALRSQLPPWIQEQAERSWGYDADHTSLLSHKAALHRFNSLLAFEAERLRSRLLPVAHSP